MADVHNTKTRSYNMSMIRSKDTPVRPAGGKPEIVFPKYKMLVFIHSCFWYGYEDCKYFVVPNPNEPEEAKSEARICESTLSGLTLFIFLLKMSYYFLEDSVIR
ncbi:MAG: hypothetical protein AYP45_06415 [Candidatus Brocadia carolinensis]|uniref:Uncharacterized protein n=1 Tax=Candidatus Brocadia carolinensis TaxID=1004156 RepID=A0A1V4AUY6_9BACT|nr:MAG: hypothetical protein AYP45_06415 [Candidatus Brocadia caroliniensis]